MFGSLSDAACGALVSRGVGYRCGGWWLTVFEHEVHAGSESRDFMGESIDVLAEAFGVGVGVAAAGCGASDYKFAKGGASEFGDAADADGGTCVPVAVEFIIGEAEADHLSTVGARGGGSAHMGSPRVAFGGVFRQRPSRACSLAPAKRAPQVLLLGLGYRFAGRVCPCKLRHFCHIDLLDNRETIIL